VGKGCVETGVNGISGTAATGDAAGGVEGGVPTRNIGAGGGTEGRDGGGIDGLRGGSTAAIGFASIGKLALTSSEALVSPPVDSFDDTIAAAESTTPVTSAIAGIMSSTALRRST
jgi:hypothetical protein